MTAPYTGTSTGTANASSASPYQPPALTGGQNRAQGYRYAGYAGQTPQTQTASVGSPYGNPSSTGQSLTSNASSPYGAYATTTPTYGTNATAGNYLNQTIQPGAMTDPVSIANQAWNTFAQSTEPQYQADLRAATQQAAGAGQLGSGQLRGSLGNVATQRTQQLATAQQSLLQNAEQQANANAYQNIGIAQQQQQFQAQQQQTAYAQALSNAQQQLAQTLGLGGLGVQQGQLALANTAQQQQNALAAGELTGNYNGQSTLGAQQLGLQSQLGLGQLGVAQQQANTQQAGTLGGLSLGQQQLAQQGSEFGQTMGLNQQQLALAQLQNQQQFGLAQGELTGNYNGQSTLGGQQVALSQLQNQQQYGLSQQQLQLAQLQNAENYGLQSNAQSIQQQQFGQSQAQQLQLAQMQDATQNRGVDVNYQLANQELLLRAALAGYGGATNGVAGGGVSASPSPYGGTAPLGTGGAGGSGNGFVDQSSINYSPAGSYGISPSVAASNQQFFSQNAQSVQQQQLQRIAQATGQQLVPTMQNGQIVMALAPQTASSTANLPLQAAPAPQYGPSLDGVHQDGNGGSFVNGQWQPFVNEQPPRSATAADLAGWTFQNAQGQPVQVDPSQVLMVQNQYGAWTPQPKGLAAQGNFTATPPSNFSYTSGQ